MSRERGKRRTLRVQVERRDQQSQIAHTATDLSAYIPRHDDDDNDGDDDDGDDDDGGSGRDRLGRNAEGGSMHVHFAFPVDDSSATSGGGDKSAGQDTWPEAMDQMEPPTFEDSHIRHSTTGDRLVFVGGERVPPPPSRRAPTRPTPTPAATRPAPAPRPRPRPRNRPSAGGASSSSSLLLDASGGGSGAAADSMDVTILNNATHEHMSFTAFAATTVRDIKSYLLRAFDIPIDCQVLTLGDTELTSGARVFALGMNADDVIVLNTRDYTAM
ncbi:hypothetical protein PTSG_04237 [Salpingoeca rosetta]|uniref:Ubiquitin-like domain-containing protein n=1 Tax=Salpingoeca rosetta (strain ATCC 50818 / BSB-021) TaxID=946362 RepID=F2U6Z7_SALR5|nr:uncharacterized protein PTSG_04237 [Salpingoeca rosetta]EGD83629.1 hypothetical protein PTSG_04237 [Salpingoeca rosetta]|eukprot:XP_004995133.1 hypothetical protein PTSG_04237 [Salpingoeca rosetta]